MNNQFEDLLAKYDSAKITQADLIKEIFAARDKWWVERIEGIFTYKNSIVVMMKKWQQLKREVGQ